MAARLVASLLPYIIVGLLLLGGIVLLLSLQQLRRGRTGPYWRLRRQAGQRGGQLFLMAVTLIGVALALAFFSGLADVALRGINSIFARDPDRLSGVVIPTLTDIPRVTLTTTPHPTETATPSATDTPSVAPATEAATESAEPTETLTVTDTPTITPTPTATFESVLALTPAVSEREPSPDAMIEIVAAASGVAPDQTPLEAGTQFAAGIQRVYLFMRYDHMANGVAWTRILFREGVPIQGQSYVWSMGESGDSFFFFGDDAGYPSGRYEARIYIGAEEVSRFAFQVE